MIHERICGLVWTNHEIQWPVHKERRYISLPLPLYRWNSLSSILAPQQRNMSACCGVPPFVPTRWGGVALCGSRRPMAFPCHWLVLFPLRMVDFWASPISSSFDVTSPLPTQGTRVTAVTETFLMFVTCRLQVSRSQTKTLVIVWADLLMFSLTIKDHVSVYFISALLVCWDLREKLK